MQRQLQIFARLSLSRYPVDTILRAKTERSSKAKTFDIGNFPVKSYRVPGKYSQPSWAVASAERDRTESSRMLSSLRQV